MRSRLMSPIGAVLCVFAYFCGSALGDLPDDFPGITVTTRDPDRVGDGYMFLATATEVPGVGYYLMILDNDGAPVLYKQLQDDYAYDFKMQVNGLLSCQHFFHHHTYTGGGDVNVEIMDDDLNVIETIQMGNGYVAEAHDSTLLPNGNVLLLGYYLTEVDMSQLVPGGHPAALVSGVVLQELDADRNVVFQWRSWDTYDFATYPYNFRIDPTQKVISRFHANTVNMDHDGNIIMGTTRAKDDNPKVFKINRQTGEVMWILGGLLNEFTPVGEGAEVGDFGGHATYRLDNGNLLMYDNSDHRILGPSSSQVHEYALDEEARIATRIWSYTPEPGIQAWHRGNAQRLPNGNTLVGWGGAGGADVPACTEVAYDKSVVFELEFDNKDVESYRAFRFPFPASSQAIEYMEIELATGNEYEFGDTGVTIDVQDGGGGYNEVVVTRERYAPIYPVFPGKAPCVLPVRVKVEEYNIDAMTAEISFDAARFGFDNPEELTIWHRTTPGQGQFVQLPTNYNPAAGELRAQMTQFGEFIFASPDVADIPFAPILNMPESYRGVQKSMVLAPRKAEAGAMYEVNQEREVLLSWSPKGLARWYFVQVATDPDFTNLVVDQSWMSECRYIWDGAEDNTTYYWRARINNEGGDGDWSVGAFRTVAPSIEVTAPMAGKVLVRGVDTFLEWSDNIPEDVVIELYKSDVLMQTIDTVPSDRAHEWVVGLGLETGCDYTIRIGSSVDETLFDVSEPFGIAATPSDFNCDGCVDVDDFLTLASAWLEEVAGSMADLNDSGKIDFADFGLFAEDWTGTCP